MLPLHSTLSANLCRLTHIVLDDGTFELLEAVNLMNCIISESEDDVDVVIEAIHRFAQRCRAVERHQILVDVASHAIHGCMRKSIRDVLYHYGAYCSKNDDDYFAMACCRGDANLVRQVIQDGYRPDFAELLLAIQSGDVNTLKVVADSVVQGQQDVSVLLPVDAGDVSVKLLDELMEISKKVPRCEFKFENFRSIDVARWSINHRIGYDHIITDVAYHAVVRGPPYIEILNYLVENMRIPVPREVLTKIHLLYLTDLSVLDYLIKHGADMYAQDEYGRDVSVRAPYILRYWLDKGMKLHGGIHKYGVRLLSSYVTVRDISHCSLLRVMRQYGIAVDMKSVEAHAIIKQACKSGICDCVRLLLDVGADVNTVIDTAGNTLLHDACRHGHIDVVSLLCDRHVNKDILNLDGNTAYHYAADLIREVLDAYVG